jgi:ribonucleoside-diphosphate reductase alpha chain
MHREAVNQIDASLVAEDLLSAATQAWDEANELGELYGVRNSQASVLAPTGTIGLMMDCDTTGIEPDLGLVKVKKLVGGGTMSIVNQTVPRALKALGYTPEQVTDIVAYIDTEKTILGAPHLQREHEPVFACSMGDNPIHYLGHVKMMSAVQPFLSGAISKTVNMPETATIEDIEQLHMDSWKLGLKAVAIYRDNCKVAQPLSMAKKEGDAKESAEESHAAQAAAAAATITAASETPAAAVSPVEAVIDNRIVVKGAVRRRLPRVRNSRTYRFQLADLKGYFTVAEYEDGTPGELFVSVSKQGSTLSGLMDSFAISVSHGLQYGVPLKSYVKTLRGTSFAPSGITDDDDIRTASSITDYIMRRLAIDYLGFDDRLELGLASFDDMPEAQTSLLEVAEPASVQVTAVLAAEEPAHTPNSSSPAVSEAPGLSESADDTQLVKDAAAPLCYNCGNQTQRAGSCYVCSSCGSTTGCS